MLIRLRPASIFVRLAAVFTASSLSGFSPPFSTDWPAAEYSASASGTPGGELSASSEYESGDFDIQLTNTGGLIWETRLLFDCLVYLDAAGQPQPWLAQSWKISSDRLTYTFELRPDVTFSDGSRFDAETVLVNFSRIKALGPKSRAAGAFLDSYDSGRALDSFTVELKLREPNHAFLGYLAQSWLGFFATSQVRDHPETIKSHPIGTGPYTLSDYTPGKRAVFLRRADYRWAPVVLKHTGPAYFQRITVNAVPDDAERVARLRQGQDQLCFAVPPTLAERLKTASGVHVSDRLRPGSPIRSLTFNTRRPPFEDVRIRRAVALAIDREPIIRSFAGAEYVPTAAFLSPNTPNYEASASASLLYSPDKAAALLDEAGWAARDADGFRVKAGRRLSAELLLTGNERTPPESVRILREQLQRLGLQLTLHFVSSAELVSAVSNRNYDAITGGWWSARSADVLYLLFHHSQALRQNTFGQDTANLADAALDELLLRARSSPDGQECATLYHQAQERLLELVPAIPLHESQTVVAWRDEVKGLLFDTSYNTPILTAAWAESR